METKFESYPKIKQKDLVGKPFAIMKKEGLVSWQRWNGTGFSIGKWDENKKFYKWDNEEKQWINIQYKREDGWRKLFKRSLKLDKEYEFEVWDKEARQAVKKPLSKVEVLLSGGVENQLQSKLLDEERRGSNVFDVFWMLNMKKIGDQPMDVEYSLNFEKTKDSTHTTATSSDKDFKIDIPKEKPDIRQQIIDAVKHQTKDLEEDKIQAYRAEIVSQIDRLLKENNIDSEGEAERIYENHILSK